MLLLTLGVLLTLAQCSYARRSSLQETAVPSTPVGSVKEYTWHVTVDSQAPDCFQRDVILINGDFQPTVEVVQGDFLKVGFPMLPLALLL